ncbi:MAG: family 43 glycosylhydrolase [Solirubrobacterales bacterium]|nr:family 43 glycosylhydrolase [Solirubrobacterales bacterium]
MRRALLAGVVALLGMSGTAAAQTATPLAAQVPAVGSPLVKGDWPDPDLSLVGGAYYTVATSTNWAPTFRVLRSTDLRNWAIAGSVFERPPRWTRDSFWAPELTELPNGRFAFFYSALPRRAWTTRPNGVTVPARGRGQRPWYCLGVATAARPEGPWRDLGRPLRCVPDGTIDPTPVAAGRRLYLVYKEDANAFGRPTPILLQRLRADGRRLLGQPRELLRNRPRSWESDVIEAPFLVRRGGWWHMLYSGALCCSRQCSYAVGSARARRLIGPWRRNPANPILRSGAGWRCPGHVSVAGGFAAFHAYRAGDGYLAGRQMHVARLTYARGWPRIGSGRPLAPTPGAATTSFDDGFAGPALAPEWEWPVAYRPGVRVGDGLALRAPVRATGGTPTARQLAGRPDAAILARRIGSDRLVATAEVDRSALAGGEVAGLGLTLAGPFAIATRAIGVSVGAGEPAPLTVWARGGGPAATYPLATGGAPTVHLRLELSGRSVRFAASPDGIAWTDLGPPRKTPMAETARIALTAGGQRAATVRFARATLAER